MSEGTKTEVPKTGDAQEIEDDGKGNLKIVLQSKDGKNFDTTLKVARTSTTIDTMIKDLNLDGEKMAEDPLPLPNVDAVILEKVLEFADHHINEKDPKVDDDGKLSDWDEKLFQELKDAEPEMKKMFDVIQAANYMDMKFLLDVGCQFVANMMKGKKPDEIRTLFNIVNDIPPEEYKKLLEETKWAFE